MAIKILTVFGTRPEVIKLAPFIKAVEADSACISVTCATTQHNQLQNEVLKLFGIKPDHDLEVMRENQDLFYVSETILSKIKNVLEQENPHWIVVQGDTTTAFIASLAAFYKNIPVVHIEAGLRSWNKQRPFPEETNRCLISKIAELHMAPTAIAVHNLAQEGIHDNVFNVGNTIVDAVPMALALIRKNDDALSGLLNIPNKKILVTVHRRENFGEPLSNICNAVAHLASKYQDTLIFWPVHPNPNIKTYVVNVLSNHPNIHLLEPLSYEHMLNLINKSDLIMTDSGGLQEEASILGKSIIILREETERLEVVESGLGFLAGADEQKIIQAAEIYLKDASPKKTEICSLYGRPGVSKEILRIIKESRTGGVA